MKKVILAILLILVLAVPAMAKSDITLPSNFTQDDFKSLTRDLGLAISYVPLAPAEPLGNTLPGFDIGVEATAVRMDTNSLYWQKVNQYNEALGNSKIPSTIPFPKFHVQVGLPIVPIDLGFVYASAPTTDIKYMGGEIKYAILSGTAVTPALALRGAYTKLSGVPDLDINTKSLDLSISKGFLIFTPYAGYGMVWISSKDKRTPGTPVINVSTIPPSYATLSAPFQDENLSEGKGFVGCKISFFPLMNLVAEADFAKVSTYSLRLNLHF